MNRLILLNVFLAVLIFVGCSTSIIDPISSTNPKILFEVEYMNGAWGWEHWGWYIDDLGCVYTYSYGGVSYEGRWNPQRAGIYTENELLEKFNHSKELVKQIDCNELSHMTMLIPYARKGKLSDPVGVMWDAGSLTYKGYLYDESKNEYIAVLLREECNYYIENLSPEAKILADWLKSVRKK